MAQERGATLSVSVVLPCLNEADSVGLCVEESLSTLRAAGLAGEVIVVDNGSTDDSAEIARRAGARVVRERRPGYGSALRAGFRAARCDVIVMADADFTYDFGKIPDLVAPIARDEADMVLGNRLDGATRQTMPFLHRYVGTPVITFLAARACGRRVVNDSQSGFRAFRRRCLDQLDLRTTGMELATEMLIRAARAGLRITEISTGYRPRIGDSKLSTFADGWRHLQLILLLAPDLLLIGPGATLFALGVLLQIVAFVAPAGVDIGSLRWQPVFFSGIAIVLGLQALLAGAVLAYHSSLAAPGARRRFDFVGRPSFTNACVAGGVLSVLTGLVVDFVLFVVWVKGDSSPASRAVNTASLAQCLIIAGGTLASFGIVSRFTRARALPQRLDRTPTDDGERIPVEEPVGSAGRV
jgi:glycosyltransferase involved in cell wall biosynthesis